MRIHYFRAALRMPNTKYPDHFPNAGLVSQRIPRIRLEVPRLYFVGLLPYFGEG